MLLTTYSNTLANALQSKLRVLLANEPKLAERIDVHSLTALGMRLHRAHVGQVQLATRAQVRDIVKEAAEATSGHKFKLPFLWAEWEHMVARDDLLVTAVAPGSEFLADMKGAGGKRQAMG